MSTLFPYLIFVRYLSKQLLACEIWFSRVFNMFVSFPISQKAICFQYLSIDFRKIFFHAPGFDMNFSRSDYYSPK